MSRSQRKLRLTKTMIEELSSEKSEYSVWDTKCEGLHVRVLPSGSKSYYVFYRDQLGRQRRRSLGKTSVVPLDQARKKAREVIADADRGHDHFDAAAKEKSVPTLEAVWADYLEDHALPKKSASSVAEDRRLWSRHIQHVFGRTRVTEITQHDVRKWHSKKSSTPYEANRALALLSVMFSFSSHLVTANPCLKVQKFPEKSRQSELSDSQFSKLIAAIEEDHDAGAIVLLKLLIWTGARRGEALKAKWDEFDLEKGIWNVPSEHIKGGVRHRKVLRRALPDACVMAMQKWRNIAPNTTGYVFPSPKDPGRPRYDISAIWKRVRRRSGLSTIRVHDLRHHFATVAVRNGISLEKVQHALGHSDTRTTLRYAHFADEDRHQVSGAVATALNME